MVLRILVILSPQVVKKYTCQPFLLVESEKVHISHERFSDLDLLLLSNNFLSPLLLVFPVTFNMVGYGYG